MWLCKKKKTPPQKKIKIGKKKGPSTRYQATGLRSGIAYTFRVLATNECASSAYSERAIMTTKNSGLCFYLFLVFGEEERGAQGEH